MSFTMTELANRIADFRLELWADANENKQDDFLQDFDNYFDALQSWIVERGGAKSFGNGNISGLTDNKGIQLDIKTCGLFSPINDAFDDVRNYRHDGGFRLWQAANALIRLANALIMKANAEIS